MADGLVEMILTPFWILWIPALFAVVVWTAFRPRNRAHYARCAAIPLTDDEEEAGHGPR